MTSNTEGKVIQETETLRLTMEGANDLMLVLENSPDANNKLIKAAQDYKNAVNGGDIKTP